MMAQFIRFIYFSVITTPLLAADNNGEKAVSSFSSPLAAGALIQTALGLVVILGLIVFLAWLLKRTNNLQSSANGQLKIIAGLPLGTRERVVLIEAGNEQILVGVTPQQIQTLHVLKSPIDTSVENGKNHSFSDKLKQIMQQQEQS
jgi:flagellar protein FliO/FliZ